ncbi:enoyl-CoA hydratase/isomerase family protein [Streptomyces sp. WM6386]|uniref:enoyl-CoA hydratase/isomerase family protein n=1 Tax=Streptomyces sp. WM6386 TaxID=1415558 RepID=UPI001F1CFAE8|nr:enoyl-CoA hydratase/isomerase family protein [Streptomyces sp. WM6386]
MSDIPVVTAAEAARAEHLLVPTATEHLTAGDVLTVVDLDAVGSPQEAAVRLGQAHRVLVGVARRRVSPAAGTLLDALTLTLSTVPQPGRSHIRVDDVDAALDQLTEALHGAPRAALTLAGLLRLTPLLPVPDALVAESLAFSMLLAGPEFAAWRRAHPARPVPPATADAVLLERTGDRLCVTLNRPARRNALGREMRDQLIDALAVAADPGVAVVHLRGTGSDFCSGGDLDEFGTAADPATAHAVRLARSAGYAVHRCAGRVQVHVRGACMGAGVEVPAFAGRMVAAPGAYFALPELSLGLVPGAGGTVSLPRRIGRWRTAWMALTGERIDAARAHCWGLVDAVTADA